MSGILMIFLINIILTYLPVKLREMRHLLFRIRKFDLTVITEGATVYLTADNIHRIIVSIMLRSLALNFKLLKLILFGRSFGLLYFNSYLPRNRT